MPTHSPNLRHRASTKATPSRFWTPLMICIIAGGPAVLIADSIFISSTSPPITAVLMTSARLVWGAFLYRTLLRTGLLDRFEHRDSAKQESL